MMETKICTKCKIEKPNTFDYFPKNGKGGLILICKTCKNTYGRRYHEEHKKTPYNNLNRRLRVDLKGQKFNFLTVIRQSHRDSGGRMKWECICDCGNISIVQGHCLTSNKVLSCNDCGSKRTGIKNTKHNAKKENKRLYETWTNMKTRCSNSKYEMYKSYGGKGIKVCEEWQEYLNFQIWALDNGYENNLTIDRIDNEKEYCPENCRWSTMKEQQNHRTNNHLITYNNETLTMKQWSEKLDINYSTMQRRIARGLTVEKVLEKK